MTEATNAAKNAQGQQGAQGAVAKSGSPTPAADRGKTTVADGVVEKIAGMAAREVPDIHSLGGSLGRTMGAARGMLPGGRTSVGRGVTVEVGERQTAVDLAVVVEYGAAITDVASDVRENVVAAVERMTGLEVVEVNIAVNDVHLPDEEDDRDEDESRAGRVR
ncbi:Asp23/Gls24 family envelope stress response protein [Streptomyces hypolithicus]